MDQITGVLLYSSRRIKACHWDSFTDLVAKYCYASWYWARVALSGILIAMTTCNLFPLWINVLSYIEGTAWAFTYGCGLVILTLVWKSWRRKQPGNIFSSPMNSIYHTPPRLSNFAAFHRHHICQSSPFYRSQAILVPFLFHDLPRCCQPIDLTPTPKPTTLLKILINHEKLCRHHVSALLEISGGWIRRWSTAASTMGLERKLVCASKSEWLVSLCLEPWLYNATSWKLSLAILFYHDEFPFHKTL